MSLFEDTLTMKSLHMLERGMDTAMLRRNVLANNIANVDVPHFKRSEVIFEAALKRSLDQEKAIESEPSIRTTHERHIARRQFEPFRDVQPGVHTDYMSSMRNDGNNVDIEDEVAKLVRNQMQYSLMVDRIGGTFRQLNTLIRMA